MIAAGNGALTDGDCGTQAFGAMMGKFVTLNTEGMNVVGRGVASALAGGTGSSTAMKLSPGEIR